ncbi:hypothetical protein [Mesobacillus thioparans]|uniref:hypothetical protein n=1 Tax=Mesobacillus thioparans TaxID=370439 RepID=UPI0039EE081D
MAQWDYPEKDRKKSKKKDRCDKKKEGEKWFKQEQEPEQIAIGYITDGALAIDDSNASDNPTNSAVAQDYSNASGNPDDSAVAQGRSNSVYDGKTSGSQEKSSSANDTNNSALAQYDSNASNDPFDSAVALDDSKANEIF